MNRYILRVSDEIKIIDKIKLNDKHVKKSGTINGIKINNFYANQKNYHDLLDQELLKLIRLIDDEVDDDDSSVNILEQVEFFKTNILKKYRKYLSAEDYQKYINYLKKYSIIISEKENEIKRSGKGR